MSELVSNRTEVRYRIRQTGEVVHETILSEHALRWFYEDPLGSRVFEILPNRSAFCCLYGKIQDLPGSHRKIPEFVATHRIPEDEAEYPLSAYETFNDFFSRRLKPQARPIALDPLMQDHHVSLGQLRPGVWAGIAMFWLLVFSWETVRKIRAKEDEDAYVTYSQIFGTRRSVLVPMLGVTGSMALACMFALRLGLSVPFVGAIALAYAYAYAMFGLVRWLFVQTPKTSKLKPFVENFTLVLYVDLIVELLVKYGSTWVGALPRA